MGRRGSINIQLASQKSHKTSVIVSATTPKSIIITTGCELS
jgi:hypothetical protein